MHLILTGATGLVGSGVLHYMISTPNILSRRPVTQAEGHEKVKVIIHKDYTTYPSELLAQLKDADGVVWAQGISSTQVGKE
jgi:aspartate-semialdehyde dehydrogenase